MIDLNYNTRLTAISRKNTTLPLKECLSWLEPETRVLDFGCGRSLDARFLNIQGWDCDKYDPYYHPKELKDGYYNHVLCFYVLNVIPTFSERLSVLARIRCLLNESGLASAFIAVRSDTIQGKAYGDGVITKKNTFQHQFCLEELLDMVERADLTVSDIIIRDRSKIIVRITL